MKITSLILILLIVVPNTFSLVDRGLLNWDQLGTWSKTHVAGGNGGVTVSGNSVSLNQQYEPRVYIMNSNGDSFYRFPNLLGRTIRFTVDISTTTCSCNAALYLLQYPTGVNNDYYCDAQGTSSLTRCVEIDIFEANSHAYQATMHCGVGGTPCQWGCGANFRSTSGFGIGGSVINTKSPFQVEMSFIGSGSLQKIGFKATQSGRVLSKILDDSACSSSGSNYISGLNSAIKSGQLVMAMSYWSSSSMDWLDGCTNGQNTCPASSSVIFSDIELLAQVTVSATADESVSAGNNDQENFVNSAGFYAMIVIGVLVVIVLAIVVWKFRSQPTEVV